MEYPSPHFGYRVFHPRHPPRIMQNGPSKTGRYSFPSESAAGQFLETLTTTAKRTADQNQLPREIKGHYPPRDCYTDASFPADGSPVVCRWSGTTQWRIRAESLAARPSPIMTLIETAMAMIRPITDWTQ
jgi:hypothetical protein